MQQFGIRKRDLCFHDGRWYRVTEVVGNEVRGYLVGSYPRVHFVRDADEWCAMAADAERRRGRWPADGQELGGEGG